MEHWKVEKLKEALTRENLVYTCVEDGGDPLRYTSAVPAVDTSSTKNMQLSKFTVSYWVPPSLWDRVYEKKYICIKVDVVSSTDAAVAAAKVEPPFGPADLECNGILLTPSLEYKLAASLLVNLSPVAKLEKLLRIIGDVREKKTRLANPFAPLPRINKLLKLGWAVEGRVFVAVTEVCLVRSEEEDVSARDDCMLTNSSASSTSVRDDCMLTNSSASSASSTSSTSSNNVDVCFICLGAFKPSQVSLQFATCCKKRVHARCARTWHQTLVAENSSQTTCPHCRAAIDIEMTDRTLMNL